MSKTFLFSPVGGTDPISPNNMRDGSMLHICRCYHVSKAYLYMSQEILEFQELDQRYTYCLDRLAEERKDPIEYEIIPRPDLEKVHEFDPFYREFREIILKIREEMEEGDRLLLNVSSGTPAMKSALLILKTVGEIHCHAIQVRTPVKEMNKHEGAKEQRQYDLHELWELDEDRRSDFENRCVEVEIPTFEKMQTESHIRKLLEKYDYAGAYELANQEQYKEMTANYIKLLEMASRRVLLDFSGVDQVLLHDKRYKLPILDSDLRKYFEYALILQMKLKRSEYADFIRGITPLLWDLYDRILKRYTDVRLEDYCIQKNNKSWEWVDGSLKGSEILKNLEEPIEDEKRKYNFHYGDVSSYHLYKLIYLRARDVAVRDLVRELRSVEKNVRNIAAHQIVSITDKQIKSKTGFTGEQIMKKIRMAFSYAGFNVKTEFWEDYDRMNDIILKEMKM